MPYPGIFVGVAYRLKWHRHSGNLLKHGPENFVAATEGVQGGANGVLVHCIVDAYTNLGTRKMDLVLKAPGQPLFERKGVGLFHSSRALISCFRQVGLHTTSIIARKMDVPPT